MAIVLWLVLLEGLYLRALRVLKRRGHNVRFITIKKLPLGKFKVTIITRTAKGHSTRSVRYYRGCRKGRPHVTHPS